ncbi:MAG: aspartate-semialdehyde dehydrogenase [Planctomycetota bacterium]|nr:aspartate-semialdehyde dehydrogenase [Planctomycetota bacterium]
MSLSLDAIARCSEGHDAEQPVDACGERPLARCPIAVVGATGAVGREVLTLLAREGVPASSVRAFASERSAGQRRAFGDAKIEIEALPPATDGGAIRRAFEGCPISIFAADGATAGAYAPGAIEAGSVVIDNSSRYRLEAGVPLVVPEVNAEELNRGPRLIANPNCIVIILLTALTPLRRAFGVRRVIASTYQAVSGAGQAAMDELAWQAERTLHQRREVDSRDNIPGNEQHAGLAAEDGVNAGGALATHSPRTPRVFREPCAFNVFSHDSALDLLTGRNVEEEKIIAESRKIWREERLAIHPTCIRVPVFRSHAASVFLELDRDASEGEVRALLSRAPGVRVIDDRAGNDFPTALKAANQNDVLVGRIRAEPEASDDAHRAEPASRTTTDRDHRSRSFSLFIAGDQLLKGAAWNAVQIAQAVAKQRALRENISTGEQRTLSAAALAG